MQSVILNMLYLNFLMNVTERPVTESSSGYTRSPSFAEDKVCYVVYEDEVCFPFVDYRVNVSQPIPEAPSSPQEIGTTFYMYSRTNFSYPKILDPGNAFSLLNCPINRNKAIRIITHGYLSSSQTLWIKGMIGELFRADEENVIVVDWNKGAHPPYIQAVANLRMVGVQLAQLIYSFVRYGDVPISSFHLIGHSLGAHLVGCCGRYLQDVYGLVLPRLTGLDPAAPFFIDAPPHIRLDSTDAAFVDVIHTDDSPLLGFPLSIGMTKPVGHLDFYPNGGNSQPMCNDFRCHHKRASKLFTESIRQSCTFIGVLCDSYAAFLQGECWGCHNDSCSPMGMKAKPLLMNGSPKRQFFLTTYGDSPFCGSHYRVTLSSSNKTTAWEHGGEFAVIGIDLTGKRDSTGEILLSEKSIFYKSGTIYRSVILASDVGELLSVSLSFHYPGSILNPMSWRIKEPTLHLDSVTVEQLQPERSWTYCFKESRLKPNKKYKLTKKNLC